MKFSANVAKGQEKKDKENYLLYMIMRYIFVVKL